MRSHLISKLKLKDYDRDSNKYYLLLISIYAIVCIIGMAHHEMWRDEVEAWLIARDSSSLGELLNNLTYTGHPFLWYFGLNLAAKITHNPVAVKAFHLAIAVGAVSVFVWFSPFDRLQKTLFCFGYFPLYEYGIISRSYSLGMLFIFVFCSLYCRKNSYYIFMAIALALASQTNVYALIVSFFLALVVFSNKLYQQVLKKELSAIGLKLYLGLGIYLCGLLGAIAQIVRASSILTAEESGAAIAGSLGESDSLISIIKSYLSSNSELEKVLTGIWRSYVPIPSFIREGAWSSNFLTDNQSLPRIGTVNTAPLLAVFLSAVLFLLFIYIFRKRNQILFIYLGGNIAIYLFGFVAKIPALRHSGHLFILLIVCCWLFYEAKGLDRNYSKSSILFDRYHKLIVTFILACQLYAGIKLYSLDLARPFSNIYSAARFIHQNELENHLIVGTSDLTVHPLSAWLNRQIYYPETKSFKTFTVWTPQSVYRDSDLTDWEIVDRVRQLKIDNSSLILVTDRHMQNDGNKHKLNLLISFKQPSLVRDEYFIYSIN